MHHALTRIGRNGGVVAFLFSFGLALGYYGARVWNGLFEPPL
jgi:hypothetical protein